MSAPLSPGDTLPAMDFHTGERPLPNIVIECLILHLAHSHHARAATATRIG